MKIERDHLLAPLTTWRIGGPARYYCEPANTEELAVGLRFAEERDLPLLFLGGASNMLISDKGFHGLAIRYLDRSEKLQQDESSTRAHLRLGSRALLSSVSRRYARMGWAGLEWAEGIPGTVGGALVGNAGAYGGEIADVVLEALTFDLEQGLRTWTKDECEFGYRTSRFKSDPRAAQSLVVAVSVSLSSSDPEDLKRRLEEISRTRKSRSPVGLSCGSVFKNPPGQHSGKLVEEMGLRGTRIGDAQISPAHGNYIVNLGAARAADVIALMDLIAETVRARTGIEMVSEVRLIGFDNGPA